MAGMALRPLRVLRAAKASILGVGDRELPVVLVADVSKSTAYAALSHVTLYIRPRVRSTCPEKET